VFCLWLGFGLLFTTPLLIFAVLVYGQVSLRRRYLDKLVRIFQEKPLFIVPRGQPIAGAEEVSFRTADGLTLHGCYLRSPVPRRGVILFGLEFGSNRWACHSYCEHLLANGYDIFAFESRGQGRSDLQPGYEPLQWVTEFEIRDVRAAISYLKKRPDADPRGVGLFGISKGGSAGLLAAVADPYVRCFVTDGIYATYTVMVRYMRKWFSIYNHRYKLQALLPLWYYGLVGLAGLRRIERSQRLRFVHLERRIARLAPRPLLMIHGSADTYIKPDMAQELFKRAAGPKEFWLVEGAKHNQALHLAGEEYRRRVLAFFNQHLGCPHPPSANGEVGAAKELAESA
jgi:alpha-beta hydrolase superfamily lysophospholipase